VVQLSTFQQTALVVLRTLIGWHFLYEGYYKLMLPGWSRGGQVLGDWSAAGYLKAASGPFADLFRGLAGSGLAKWIDVLVPVALLLIGLSLILGLFTQAGCLGALALLTVFYLSAIPTAGVPQAGAEGTYLLVSKNLLEWAAVLALFSFRTGRIAGLDLLLAGRNAQARLGTAPSTAAGTAA
jgi:thiosulfate dehydrogenase (quinone) large subunit